LRVDRTVENALKIAEWLEKNEQIEFVNYPGLTSSKYHRNAQKYLKRGFGGVLSFKIKGEPTDANELIDSLTLVSHLANVGDSKTVIIHPSATTHEQLSLEEQLKTGVKPGLLRLSVGTEHVEDIIADLQQALEKVKAGKLQIV
jgi:O-acetylhomoserine (thiol)-lyase